MLMISLFGATVTSWKQGGKERLFLSSKSSLDSSKAVSSDGIPEVMPLTLSFPARLTESS